MTGMLYGHSLVEWYATRYARMNMRAIVEIFRVKDPEHLDQDPTAASERTDTLYVGPGRLYSVSGGTMSQAMEDETIFSSSYISTPMLDENNQPVMSQANDLIKINEHSDPLAMHLVFRILDVDAGGQWPSVRRHMVTGATRSATWTWTP